MVTPVCEGTARCRLVEWADEQTTEHPVVLPKGSDDEVIAIELQRGDEDSLALWRDVEVVGRRAAHAFRAVTAGCGLAYLELCGLCPLRSLVA